MKKIGLLTFHYKNNFGAVLQTYATIKYLEKCNHDVTLINLVRKPKNKFISLIYERFINYNFWKFRNDHFKNVITNKIYTCEHEKLRLISKDFDLFIVGSDQVWRTEFTPSYGYSYFLDFVKDKKKLSYASSFGNSQYIGDKKSSIIISEYLKDFFAISVREFSGVQICNDFFGVQATNVVDPTLLLNSEDYIKLFRVGKRFAPRKSLVKFLLDDLPEEEVAFITDFGNMMNLEIMDVSIPKLKIGKRGFEAFPISVEKWLDTLNNSDIIITESFHCVVFAIIFQKKFICLLNERRGTARLESLLGEIGLTHLMISFNEASAEKIHSKLAVDIDYESVWQILSKKIIKSKNFLSYSIEEEN